MGSHNFDNLYYTPKWSREFRRSFDSNPKTDLSLKLKETQSAMKQAGRPQEGKFDAKIEHLLTMDHHASRNHLNDDNLGKQISQKLSDITKDGVFKDATKTVLHMRKAPIAQKKRAVESMNLPVLGDVPKLNVLDKKKSIKYQLGSSLSHKLSSKNDLKSRSRSIMHSYEAIPRSIATVYALKNRRIKVLSGIKQLKTKSKNMRNMKILDEEDTLIGRLKRVKREVDTRLDNDISSSDEDEPKLDAPKQNFISLTHGTSTLDFISKNVIILKENRDKEKQDLSKKSKIFKKCKASLEDNTFSNKKRGLKLLYQRKRQKDNNLNSVFKSMMNPKSEKFTEEKNLTSMDQSTRLRIIRLKKRGNK
ncbi:unnamed protein product [Moneuplotes crassus]|uniref:Uncharacterized protein n=1 Tax=Euplotes crassus TaxID=5936 RepID=A0AAD1X3P2_EUPCR|nr:unnamed protein product [Moneuplotes crassus]